VSDLLARLVHPTKTKASSLNPLRCTTVNILIVGLLATAIWPRARAVSGNWETAEVKYVDATEAAGLHFLHRNSATPNKYLIETMTGGVAIFDYDNDGWPDVFFVNGARLKNFQADGEPLDKSPPDFWNRLFRNNRDGTFTDVTEKAGLKGTGYGMGVAVGDYNNDGYPDLLVTNYRGAILYRNNGDGSFTDVTVRAGLRTEGWLTSAGFFDYNNDGCLDLFICRYLQWDFARGSMFCGLKTPGGRAYCHPDEFKPVSNYLFKNNCDGTFTDVSESTHIKASEGKSLGLAFADFNNDGLLDIYVANDSFRQFLFKNNGDGSFGEVGTSAGVGYTEEGQTFAGMGTDFVDLDDDGYPDIITTALPYQYYAFFHNNGDGTFNNETETSNLDSITNLFGGWGMRIFDYDNDGRKEVFIANSHVMDNIEMTQPQAHYLQRLLLLRYEGRRFVDISKISGDVFQRAWASRGAAFGDLDNDGDIDIVISTCNGPAHLLRNDGGNKNHWIGLDLRGTKSNRDGIGTKIALTTQSGKTQYNMATTTGSYLSANDRRIFFGIGKEKAIKDIRIRWPSGTVEVIPNPKADQILKVQESAVQHPGTVP
jgi:enediyne biosynthesis protein E4